MTTWTAQSTVLRARDVAWRAFDGEVALVHPATGQLRTLNEVGARIWQLADGRPFEALVTELLNEFDVDRTSLEADVRAFLDDLTARGMLSPPP